MLLSDCDSRRVSKAAAVRGFGTKQQSDGQLLKPIQQSVLKFLNNCVLGLGRVGYGTVVKDQFCTLSAAHDARFRMAAQRAPAGLRRGSKPGRLRSCLLAWSLGVTVGTGRVHAPPTGQLVRRLHMARQVVSRRP